MLWPRGTMPIVRTLRDAGKEHQQFARKVARQRTLCQGDLTSAYLKANAHWDGLDKRGN